MANPVAPENVAKAMIHNLTEARVTLGACNAVLVWEWLTQIHLEYRYIWKAPIKVTTILFLLLRYFTFVAVGIVTWLFFWTGSDQQCKSLVILIQILPMLVLSVAHILVTLRIYALYDKNNLILTCLSAFVVAQVVVQSLASRKLSPGAHVSPLVSYCLPAKAPEFAVFWALPLAFDVMVFILAVSKLVRIWQSGGKSRLVRVLFRDQILWFFLIMVISVINIVVAYGIPKPPGIQRKGIVSNVVVALTSMATCRVILNIRRSVAEEGSTLPWASDKGDAMLQPSETRFGGSGTKGVRDSGIFTKFAGSAKATPVQFPRQTRNIPPARSIQVHTETYTLAVGHDARRASVDVKAEAMAHDEEKKGGRASSFADVEYTYEMAPVQHSP